MSCRLLSHALEIRGRIHHVGSETVYVETDTAVTLILPRAAVRELAGDPRAGDVVTVQLTVVRGQ